MPRKKRRPKVKRLTKSEREKNSKEYEWAAWVSSCGITSIAITATYFRLLRDYNLVDESAFPTAELFGAAGVDRRSGGRDGVLRSIRA